jgi:hypothetical protein
LQPTQVVVELAIKQLTSVVVPETQVPFWASQYEVEQVVQAVADVQVAQPVGQAVQADEPNVPAPHEEQLEAVVVVAAHGMQVPMVAAVVETWYPRLQVRH